MSLDNIAKLMLLRKNMPLDCIWPGLGHLHMIAMRNLMVRKGKNDVEFIELMNNVFNNIHNRNIITIREILTQKDINGETKTRALLARTISWLGPRVDSLLARIHLGVSLEDAYVEVVANYEMTLVNFKPVKKITGYSGEDLSPKPQKEHIDWAARTYISYNPPDTTSTTSEPSAKRPRTD